VPDGGEGGGIGRDRLNVHAEIKAGWIACGM
jgi:hypothetical protein